MVNDAIANGWGDKCYYYIDEFEKSFSEYVDSRYALATSSCTGAIHLALLACGIMPGDEVILPDITWIASVEPVLYIGAKPVMVDIKEDTWCIDPEKIKSAITDKTKAIIVVHLYGNMPNMDEIISIAEKHSLYVIEDAAEAFGSEYKSRRAGSIGHVGVFSFHGTKTVSTGEGGMLVTNDEIIFKKAKVLNNHGRDTETDPVFRMKNYGYKYKMSNLQAAMGYAQMIRADELVDKKRKIFDWYSKRLSHYGYMSMNPVQPEVKNSYWMPTLLVHDIDGFNREDMMKYMLKRSVDSRPFFYPLTSLPMFEQGFSNRNAYNIFPRGINLPSYPDMSEQDADYVVDVMVNYFNRF